MIDATIPAMRGERLVLRSATVADLPDLARIMTDPGVEATWGEYDTEEFRAEFDHPEVRPLVIEVDGRVVGYVELTEELDPDYRHAGIDIALDDEHQGRGLGTEAITLLVRYLFAERGHHRVTIDPALANTRAIRCYEKVGFRPIGVMREYERGADGVWHDALLMELLASDLA